MSYLQNMTEEERRINLEKARAARAAKAEDRANNVHNLKLDYLDSSNWAELASKYKIRMPNNNDPITTGSIAKYLKRVGITREQFNDVYTSGVYFMKHNPKFSQYAMAGLMLEIREYG